MAKRKRKPSPPAVIPSRSSDQEKLVKAAAHPLRARAMSVMVERPTSPKEFASLVGKSVPHVSYHFRELSNAGLIELVEEKKRRGATEHFYRCPLPTVFDDEEFANLDPDKRLIVATVVLHLIIGDSGRSLESGHLLQHPGEYLTRTPLSVDDEGWSELREIFMSALKATLEVSVKSAQREAAGKPQTRSIRAALMLFDMPPE
jgi:DNA-binding transcriptional ArsR family regulator